MGQPLFRIMLGAIQLNNQFGRCTIEINNKGINNTLFIHLYWIFPQK